MSRAWIRCRRHRRWQLQDAKKFVAMLQKNGRSDRMQVWRCSVCGWFHVGHAQGKPWEKANLA